MEFCTVTKEGDFSIQGDLRVLYTTMMTMRNLITNMCGHQAILSIKLGLRYAIVRR
jgi:hypothetical protein